MTGSRTVLDPGELTIAHARLRARELGYRLAVVLVDRRLYEELQRFLDDVGFRACDALDDLAGGAESSLKERLHVVLGIGAAAAGSEVQP